MRQRKYSSLSLHSSTKKILVWKAPAKRRQRRGVRSSRPWLISFVLPWLLLRHLVTDFSSSRNGNKRVRSFTNSITIGLRIPGYCASFLANWTKVKTLFAWLVVVQLSEPWVLVFLYDRRPLTCTGQRTDNSIFNGVVTGLVSILKTKIKGALYQLVSLPVLANEE